MTFSFGLESTNEPETLKVSYTDPDGHELLAKRLYWKFSQVPRERQIVIVCVGTDRSTGDALGPLVGSHLMKINDCGLHLYGTLEDPVHAVNLSDTLSVIDAQYDNPFIVAVDACLGQLSSVGCIQIGEGPVKPGAGVHKSLPPVGNMHVTGVVNVGGFMEYFVLQNTRLSLVVKMAEMIADAIHMSFSRARRPSAAPVLKLD